MQIVHKQPSAEKTGCVRSLALYKQSRPQECRQIQPAPNPEACHGCEHDLEKAAGTPTLRTDRDWLLYPLQSGYQFLRQIVFRLRPQKP